MSGIRIFYSDGYSLPPGDHVFPAVKYRLTKQRLLEQETCAGADSEEPRPARDNEIALVHTREYMNKLKHGRFCGTELERMEVPSFATRSLFNPEGVGQRLGARADRPTAQSSLLLVSESQSRADPASNAGLPCDKKVKKPQRRARMASFTERMLGAAKLDARTYEEVEADTDATGQALGVVVLSSIAAGIGSFGFGGISGMVWGCVAALIGWVLWAFLIWLIGTKMLPEPQTKSDVPELLRTTGFASAPGVLRILGILPLVGLLISFLAHLWTLVAMVIAVRHALDYQSTARAVAVCLIGFLVNLILVWLLLPRATLTGGFGI